MSERPLRVALLVRRFARAGGNERYAVELVDHLERRGHTVAVYCQKVTEDAQAVLRRGSVHQVGGVRFDPTIALVSFVRATQRIVRGLRAEGATDAIIGFNQAVVQDVARLGGGVHAAFLEATKGAGGSRHPVLDRVALELERRRMRERNTPRFVVASRRVARELAAHYEVPERRIHLVPNGVDLSAFSAAGPEGERAAIRAAWGVSEREPVALFVGQDPWRKGFDLALEAARRAKCRLVYVGPDAPKGGGFVDDGPQLDVAARYRAADVLLAPSRYEPFGRTILEATACHRPVVASRRTGATERLIGHPALEAGLVDDPEDVDALTEALERALSPGARREVAAAAPAALEGAGLERWAQGMEAVLRAVAEAATSRPSASGRS